MATTLPAQTETLSDRDQTLLEIQNHVLWLAVQMVHHANNVRPNPDGLKVGGHQASSSSVVTIMTSLFFDFMTPGDKICIKPHASPVFHAIQFLLGNLDAKYLTTLRELHGIQSYPSRNKDPDHVDFSCGSMGLGPLGPNFAALTDEYIRSHFESQPSRPPRYISMVGDAELDEGSVWEAVAEPSMDGLGNILWVVDLNRQSLDRIIPGIRVRVWREMFAANGWRVIDAKYGTKLQAAFAEPNGELLRNCIDEMSNEVYQRLLRLPATALREWLPRTSRFPKDMGRLMKKWDDEELQELFRNLGGHDFATLREAFAQADVDTGPNVVMAYTLKGWMLPSVGDPQNHSVVLTEEQMEMLREELGIAKDKIWASPKPDSPAARLFAETRERMYPVGPDKPLSGVEPVPPEFDQPYRGKFSTQQIFGLILTNISRNAPHMAERIVTLSPDVASSTNLGGWINKVRVWTQKESEPLPEEEIVRALKWEESPQGQHIELGISEINLFMALGQLGLSHEMLDELLFPIGVLYDCFVRRGLDAYVHSLYSGAKFLAVGTPSGITLGPEGGAHQSLLTPSIGTELPEVSFYEPCFGQELEWIMLHALEQIRLRKESTYLRLTSWRVDQGLFEVPSDPSQRERLRQQVLMGAHRLVDRSQEPGYRPGENVVQIMASGTMVPEAIEASRQLVDEGVLANVISVTGPGPLYRHFQETVRASAGSKRSQSSFLAEVIPPQEERTPVVTVVDGHPHSLAWVGGALNTAVYPLGVTRFGQSGSRSELYREYEIDVASIMNACFAVLGT